MTAAPGVTEPIRRTAAVDWPLTAGVVALALGLRLPVLLERDPVALLAHHGSDDLFYFTEIARNLAVTGIPSFDGVHPTTGVQPLLALLLVPFTGLFGDRPDLALRIDLALASLLTILGALLIARVCRQVSPDLAWTGRIAALLWVAHPRVLDVTFEGTEAALAATAWLLSLSLWLGERERARPEPWRLGAALGVGILARIDHLVLAAVLIAVRPWGGWRSARSSLALAAVAAAVAAPWFLWCQAVVGTPIPDSGAAKQLHAELLRADRAAEHDLAARATELAVGLRHTAASLLLAGSRPSWWTLALGGCGLLLLAATRRGSLATTRIATLGRRLWPLPAAAAAVTLAHVALLGAVRSWYLAPAFLCLVLGAAALVTDVAAVLADLRDDGSPKARDRGPWLALALALVWCLGVAIEAHLAPRRPWNHGFAPAAKRLTELARPGDRIGAFNAGVLGAFRGPGLTVVNLDGVANHAALEALRRRDLGSLVDGAGITWIVDHPGSVAFYLRHAGADLEPRLRRVDSVEISGTSDVALGIWRVARDLETEELDTEAP